MFVKREITIRFFATILVLLVLCPQVKSQESKIIKGKVSEKIGEEMLPLPGVTIAEFDANNRLVKGTITDANGNFILEVTNQNNTIQVSYIGYTSQEFKAGSISQNQEIVLQQGTSEIDEVVITAKSTGNTLTGIVDRDLTTSSTKIDMSEIKGKSGSSVESALQGQVSGLDIVAASGSAGSGANITIRGMGTLGNANPLIVVDGIPQEVVTDNFSFATANEQDLGQLLNIAPQDIQSVEVLKDAASTAVWGSKGASGVLLIETKKGTEGKIRFNYEYKLSMNTEPPSIPMLNGDEYITLQLEEHQNLYGVYDIPREIAYDRNYSNFYNYSQNTDWVKAISRNAFTDDHHFEISGGDRKALYYTSVNYRKENGTTINNSFRRFSIRANFEYNISNFLRLTTNFGYTNTFTEDNPVTAIWDSEAENWMTIRGLAYRKSPNMSIWEYDENGELTGDYFTPIESYQGAGNLYWNPVAVSNLGVNDDLSNTIDNNFKLDYNLNDWLKMVQTVAFSYANVKESEFLPSAAIGASWLDSRKNSSFENNKPSLTMLSRTQMFFSPFHGNRTHSLLSSVLWEMEQKQNEWMAVYGTRSPSSDILDPASGSPIEWMGSSKTLSRLFGGLVSVHYKYNDKYLFSLNMRADGNSAYSKQNRWGFFPSASVGWRFSEEDFLSPISFINDSKIRVSWGQSGKKVDRPYARFSIYTTDLFYMDEPAIHPINMELSNLKWETVTSWNIGLDLNLFNYFIEIHTDIYDKVTTDLLWNNYIIPSSTGYNGLTYFNGGELQNTGWEGFIRGYLVKREEFIFSMNFNISQNLNKFLKFPENFRKDRGSSIGNGVFPIKVEEGKPLGSFYGFRYLGVYPTDEDAYAVDANGNRLIDSEGEYISMTYQGLYNFQGGDAKYEDVNKDGKIDLLDVVYIGNASPNFIGGFGTSVRYRQITFDCQFHFRTGFDIVNKIAMNTQGMLNKDNQSRAVLRRWRRDGQDEPGMLPRAYLNHPSNNLGSNRYVEKGDFLRLNTLSLNYRLSPEIAGRLFLDGLEIGFISRKLFTLTNYSGVDPEIGRTTANPFWLGQDNARTPPPREYSIRISMYFM